MPITISGSTGIAGVDGSSGTPSIQGTDANSGVYFTPSGDVAISTNGSATTFNSTGDLSISGTVSMGTQFLRNRIINGNMYVAQRTTSASVTAGTAVPTASTGYPCVDRWFVYCQGANVTAAQISGSGANRNILQITGAASNTVVGIGQRIESLNCYDLAGSTCELSFDMANSLLTTVTYTVSYANTTDAFGTIGTPTKTTIATGTINVTSTLSRYAIQIALPAAATTGIEILFTVASQTSGTWHLSNVQFEPGTIPTPFETRPFGFELALCQRYHERPAMPSFYMDQSLNTAVYFSIPFKVTKRATPTITASGTLQYYQGGAAVNLSGQTYSGDTFQARILCTGLTNGTGFPAQSQTLVANCEVP